MLRIAGYYAKLNGKHGEIIVSGDIIINGQVTGGSGEQPLFVVTTRGNLTIKILSGLGETKSNFMVWFMPGGIYHTSIQ